MIIFSCTASSTNKMDPNHKKEAACSSPLASVSSTVSASAARFDVWLLLLTFSPGTLPHVKEGIQPLFFSLCSQLDWADNVAVVLC